MAFKGSSFDNGGVGLQPPQGLDTPPPDFGPLSTRARHALDENSMEISQQHITAHTPLGVNLFADGATFRVWAPRAEAIYLNGDFSGAPCWTQNESNKLVKDADGYWAGFMPGVKDGDQYKFFVVGQGSQGYKRDPYARELTKQPAYPHCNCIVRDAHSYPWHDQDYRPPAFNDLIVYQFHVGTFYGPDRETRVAKFLDVLDRLDYLVALGINAIEPLPVVEYASPRSMGYDGSDIFSPEMDYNVDPADLAPYLGKVNALLARRGHPALTFAQLAIPINQLKALIDIYHLYGVAVILDVVYNHAGFQIGGQDESLYFFDRAAGSDPNDSLYFTDRTHTGPVFALWKKEVRQFLIDNAGFFASEYHIDGLRYDQVSVMVDENANHGWRFCQDLTGTIRFNHPGIIQISEYWPVNAAATRSRFDGGAGFNATWHDGLRESIRSAISQAAGGRDSRVNLDAIAQNLYPAGFSAAWKAVQCIESHDEVYKGREPRIAALADSSNSHSWYARSRSRVATGLLLTAPGIPMLFMGQEFLEDKPWSDNPSFDVGTLLGWEGLEQPGAAMTDHLRFTQELIGLRRRHPALRGEWINTLHVHNDNRVIAYHRWLEGIGRDVVVVASLNESTLYNYRLGFPRPGQWLEVFNSDIYDHWVNPQGVGNNGSIIAYGPPMHNLSCSAGIVIPANSILVFSLDTGDSEP